jgi:DNA-binding CsgD family transcriptional regulator
MAGTLAGRDDMGESKHLKLRDVRDIFGLIGEIRELGADPEQWRPHMVRRLQSMLDCELVISSEVHFQKNRGSVMRVIDIGWGCGSDGETWRIFTEREGEKPEDYWLTAAHDTAPAGEGLDEELVPVRPRKPLYGGHCFILSQYPLPHVGAVDQLGVHRTSGEHPFTRGEHRLVHLLHVELGRLWRKDALKKAQDPAIHLPPRLAQTLQELLEGASEKQIAMKLELSRHTIHNYVKALHQRFQVSSRGELLAKVGKEKRPDFRPKLSLEFPETLSQRPPADATQ